MSIENVTGPSADLGFFENGESFRTQILTFDTNTAHSNRHTGFFFGSFLMANQDFNGYYGPGGTELCNPRKYPLGTIHKLRWQDFEDFYPPTFVGK